MPGLKSVTHVSDTSVTYVSGLYTLKGRGRRELHAKQSRRQDYYRSQRTGVFGSCGDGRSGFDSARYRDAD
jgi:hypothetical protein